MDREPKDTLKTDWYIHCNMCHNLNPRPKDWEDYGGMECNECGYFLLMNSATESDVALHEQQIVEREKQNALLRSVRLAETNGLVDFQSELPQLNPVLRPVYDSFKTNFERAQKIVTFPQFLVGRSMLEQRFRFMAEEFLAERGNANPTQEQVASEMQDLLSKLVQAVDLPNHIQWFGRYHIGAVIKKVGEETDSGVEAIHSSQIIATWTAVEVLIEDIFCAVLNAAPSVVLKVLNRDDKDKFSIELPNSIPLADIHKRMGDVLHEQQSISKGIFRFTNFREAKAAYYAVFGDSRPFKLIWEDNRIYLLAKLRNVLVHKAGVVDDKFHNDVDRDPELHSWAVGKPVVLTGCLVRGFLVSAEQFSVSLIKYFNTWLATNSEI